jgi:RAD54-like protein 2
MITLQIGGIRFMYDNLVESVKQFKASTGFGCILAHSMGLGKTVQVIGFIDVFMRSTGARTVLVIVPVNTLQNWVHEFNMWLPRPEDVPEEIPREELQPRPFDVHVITDSCRSQMARANIVGEWAEFCS